jgi:hypothetical protein
MAALCLDANLETLRPLCYRGAVSRGISATDFTKDLFRLSRLLWRFWQPMSSKTAHNLWSRGLRSGLPRGPILGADKGRNVPPQPLLSRLGFWAGTESWWKTHSWPLKRVMLSSFTAPCSTSSWYTRTPISPLSCKNEDVSPRDGTPPTKPWCRKGDGIPAPSECTSRDVWA